MAALSDLAGAQFASETLSLFRAANEPDAPRRRVTTPSATDRSRRGQIHQEVRRIFRSRIDTSTDESGAIVASLVTKRGRKRNRNPPGTAGAAAVPGSGDYLHFTLYKDNRDTMDAVNQVARMLRVKPQVVGYAGTKDRRASTAQRCSLRHARPHALAAANARLRGVVTGDYRFAERPIHLGGLRGNEFVIVIKDCRLSSVTEQKGATLDQQLAALRAAAAPALDHMARHGWINYFGHQRFGTHRVGTHEVGRLILGERYKEAVEAILSYDPEIAEAAEAAAAAPAEEGGKPLEASARDERDRHHACMLFLTGRDRARAAQLMPRRFGAETCILRHLNRAGASSLGDHVGALVHITRGLRSMYLHAYQSHVWNHVASRRWERHGAAVVAGDLVVDDGAAAAAPAEPEQDQDGDDIITPAAPGGENSDDRDDDDEGPLRARPVTQAEVDAGTFTIHDVVLPSPGYEVVYPDNEVGAYYTEFMAAEENGGLDPRSMRRLRREFSLPGRYRRLVNRFLDVDGSTGPSVEFTTYKHDTDQMHPTDLDVAKQNAPAAKKAKTEEDKVEAQAEDKSEPSEEKKEDQAEEPERIAAIVKFQLGSSAYATVALRELMGDGE